MYLKYSTRSPGGVVSTIVHTTSSAVSTSGHLGVLLSIYGLPSSTVSLCEIDFLQLQGFRTGLSMRQSNVAAHLPAVQHQQASFK